MRTITHIALAEQWTEALRGGHYVWSTRGMTIEDVGYLHASFPEQVHPTLERFYADVGAPLVLLTLDEEALAARELTIRVEPADPNDAASERFPHVYGGPLPVSCVRSAQQLELPGSMSGSA